jgi:hypothetical protein
MLDLDQLLEVCSSPLLLSAPNKHHFRYDLSRFGLPNNNEVFHADDRPYGLIQATVTRDDAPAAGPAWDSQLGWLAVNWAYKLPFTAIVRKLQCA